MNGKARTAGRVGTKVARQLAARHPLHPVQKTGRPLKLIAPTANNAAGQSLALSRRPYRSLGTTWHFFLLHVAGLIVTLPLIAAARLLPGRWHKPHDESVFVETNRAVLTALGFAFMA